MEWVMQWWQCPLVQAGGARLVISVTMYSYMEICRLLYIWCNLAVSYCIRCNHAASLIG